MKNLRDLFADLFKSDIPLINENSSLHEIAVQYPHVYDFIERKYSIKVHVGDNDNTITLKEFVTKYGLPPAQVLFMEVQLDLRANKAQELTAHQAKTFLEKNPATHILDVREEWEVKIGRINNSKVLSPVLLDQILNTWKKETPILIYCHHGVRSMDAATFFVDHGFNHVYTLRGGIDSWSMNVDSSIPRYQGAYC
jgi:rhodanese-related sulfurtransferase